MFAWFRRLVEGPPLDLDAILRDRAEQERPRTVIRMEEHLAQLPQAPPMFEPEWANDTEWRDSREED